MRGKAWKLWCLTRNSVWRRGLCRGVAATVEHEPALAGLHVATVLDVGANKGQFALFARSTWPQAEIIAFEPLPEPAHRFRWLFNEDAKVHLIEAALGPEQGNATIHVSRRADSSSLLPIGAGQRTCFPGTEEVGQQRIAIGRLGNLLDPTSLKRPILLKLDVQGFELAALESAEEYLNQIDHVYCECSFVELYDGQALAAQVIGYLNQHGFMEEGRFNLVQDPGGAPIQADILFGRRTTSASSS